MTQIVHVYIELVFPMLIVDCLEEYIYECFWDIFHNYRGGHLDRFYDVHLCFFLLLLVDLYASPEVTLDYS